MLYYDKEAKRGRWIPACLAPQIAAGWQKQVSCTAAMRPLGRVAVCVATRPVCSGPVPSDPAQASRAERMCAMRYRLMPGLLAEQRIEYDDVQHKLRVGLYLVPLSPNQYLLVAALVRQRQRWEVDTDHKEPLILTVAQLQQLAALPTPSLVKKHLSEAALRVPRDELLIVNLHGYGYGIFRPWEVPVPGLAWSRRSEDNGGTTLRDF